MNKNVAIALGSIIVGCVGLVYALSNKHKNETGESDEEPTLIEQIVEGVKEYMSNKTNAVGERIQFCKDIMSNKSYRLTIGLVVVGAGIGIGAGLIASAYIPLPA